MTAEVSQVSPAFAALVRKRELSLCAPARQAEIAAQLDDSQLRPLLNEQLCECAAGFARLAQPTGSVLVSERGLAPLAAQQLFEAIPVLPQDRVKAEELACAEYRRIASTPPSGIPGAALALHANGEVSIRPIMPL